RVSVVVCTFNGERTLRPCLEGLMALRYPDFEVIVVNDGSTDSTLAIASEYDVWVISTENGGLATARNLGMRAATGEIVAYLDDDAQPDRDWLRYLVCRLLLEKKKPHAQLLYLAFGARLREQSSVVACSLMITYVLPGAV